MKDSSHSLPEGPEKATRVTTHRDLMPEDLCQHLMFKQILIEGLDDPTGDDRVWPGDGYYWCLLTLHDIGPDDELVEPPACRGERSCCESLQF